MWFEPRVGELFDPKRMKLDERRGKPFILASQYRQTWLRSIRNFVLDGANVRFPEMSREEYLVIKEPGGSVGAPLLMQALPESRMVLLIRDPRDVVASWLDRYRKGNWRSHREQSEEQPAAASGPASWQVENMLKIAAKRYQQNVEGAERAYEEHEGRKALVRYEDLLDDTLSVMRRMYCELDVSLDEAELSRAVARHSWEEIPEEKKGEGKFYRKASPGGWREDLTSEQVRTVERITAPLIERFYPDSSAPGGT